MVAADIHCRVALSSFTKDNKEGRLWKGGREVGSVSSYENQHVPGIVSRLCLSPLT